MLGGVLGGAHAIRLPEVPTRTPPAPLSLSAAPSRTKSRAPLSSLSLALLLGPVDAR